MIDGIWKFKRGKEKDNRVHNLKVVGYMAPRSLVYCQTNGTKAEPSYSMLEKACMAA
jgi:hypothetical protein